MEEGVFFPVDGDTLLSLQGIDAARCFIQRMWVNVEFEAIVSQYGNMREILNGFPKEDKKVFIVDPRYHIAIDWYAWRDVAFCGEKPVYLFPERSNFRNRNQWRLEASLESGEVCINEEVFQTIGDQAEELVNREWLGNRATVRESLSVQFVARHLEMPILNNRSILLTRGV
jgi:hypothetical protein